MELIFQPETHTYKSIKDPNKKWISVTTLINQFKEHFDQETIALKASKNKKSKWYGMTPEAIIEHWNKESERSILLGKWYHSQREEEVSQCETIRRDDLDLPIIIPLEKEGIRVSPDQVLKPGIYPEHFMYLKSAGVCGQADRVEVIGNRVDIYDYKTNKKIDLEGYTNWEGITKKMLHPLENLDDCNLVHYSLQLSLYMYIILKQNPKLIPGNLYIHHIQFDLDGKDDNGFPILAVDLAGDPVVKEVIPYKVPYLQKEIVSLINYVKQNPKIYDKII